MLEYREDIDLVDISLESYDKCNMSAIAGHIYMALFGANTGVVQPENPNFNSNEDVLTNLVNTSTPINLLNPQPIGSGLIEMLKNSSTVNLDLNKIQDTITDALQFLIANEIVTRLTCEATLTDNKLRINIGLLFNKNDRRNICLVYNNNTGQVSNFRV